MSTAEDLARICRTIGSTTGRKEKVRLLAEYLRSLDEEELGSTVLLLLGHPFPDSDPRTLDIGYRSIEEAMGGRQTTLFDGPLTISEVSRILSEISKAKGAGSRKVRRNLLRNLFGRASPEAAEYLVRSIFGEMRIGVNEGLMLEAIAEASHLPVEEVRRANMLSGDITRVAREAVVGGDLGDIGIELLTPIRPMLAESVGSVEEALAIHPRAAFESKLDGARVQVHKAGEEVRVFSRRLSDVTSSLPEVVDLLRGVEGDVIVEGEVVAYRDRPLPFQDLMRRFRRVRDVEDATREVPVRLFLFDILYLDRPLLDMTNLERREELEGLFDRELLVPRRIVSDRADGERFFDLSLAEGHEGVMVKDLASPYRIGKRGKPWLKVKRARSLDLVVIAAEWGHGRRKGWLSDYHLGAVDGLGFAMVGKTFKGLTDEEFGWMTGELLKDRVAEEGNVVEVAPRIVVEVEFDDVQRSPRYDSGLALRFARIKAIRPDRDPSDADGLETVRCVLDERPGTEDRAE